MALDSEEQSHFFFLGRLYVICKNRITEEIPSVINGSPKMIFVKPGYIAFMSGPYEGDSQE